jgi:hypothetical protein
MSSPKSHRLVISKLWPKFLKSEQIIYLKNTNKFNNQDYEK